MAAPPTLPVIALVRAAWRQMWAARSTLALLAGVLTAASILVALLPWPRACGEVLGLQLGESLVIDLPRSVAGPDNAGRAEAISRFLCRRAVDLPPAVVALLLGVVFAVAWHRAVLLPGEKQSPWTVYGWDWRKTKTALAAALLLLPTIAGLLAAGLLGAAELPANQFRPASAVLLPAVAALTAARFLLVFPALATDRGGHPGRSWRWTRGNTWRLAAIVLLAALPFLALRHGLGEVARLVDDGRAGLASAVVAVALAYLALAAAVTALALAYRDIRDHFYEYAAATRQQPGEMRLRAGPTT